MPGLQFKVTCNWKKEQNLKTLDFSAKMCHYWVSWWSDLRLSVIQSGWSNELSYMDTPQRMTTFLLKSSYTGTSTTQNKIYKSDFKYKHLARNTSLTEKNGNWSNVFKNKDFYMVGYITYHW